MCPFLHQYNFLSIRNDDQILYNKYVIIIEILV